MNDYLRSIGFSKVKTNNQIKTLSNSVLETPSARSIMSKNNDDIYIEYYKEYCDNLGLSVKGYIEGIENFSVNNLMPYVFTNNLVNINKIHAKKNGDGLILTCQEKNTLNDFSFYLHNIVDYFNNKDTSLLPKINVVGLSLYGKIILPIFNSNYSIDNNLHNNSKEILKASKNNTSEKFLVIRHEDNNKTLQERLKEEDFLSVVRGYFLKTKTDETCYCVLGDIIEINKIFNTKTEEHMYVFMLNITDINIEICINVKDLIGMPSVGMRFMGQCWLQGKVCYNI